jgi:hypothetical protein
VKAAKGPAWSLRFLSERLTTAVRRIATCKSKDPKRFAGKPQNEEQIAVSESFTKTMGWFGIQGLAPGDSNPRRCHNWREYLELGGEPCGYRGYHYPSRVDGTANAIAVAALQSAVEVKARRIA